jgi:SAM-dependent methyltransferase
MLPNTGERQVGEQIEHIKPNHRQRYAYAISAIEKKYGKDAKINILDAACGVGYGTMMLAASFPNATVTGVDVFEDAIGVANKCYKRENNNFAVLDLSDTDAWPYEPDTMDAIVSIETIEHVKNDEDLIRRYSLTAPFLVGSVPNEKFVPFDPKQHPFHHRHYTKLEFIQLLSNHKYDVNEWVTQYDKIPGDLYLADDGMGFVVSATRL